MKHRAIVAALLLTGCADPVQRTADEALALQRSVTLPSVTVGGTAARSARLRVVVSQTGISVDDAALFASWPAPRRARLIERLGKDEAAALPFFHRDLIRVAGGRVALPYAPPPGAYDLRALHTVLDFARDIERRYADVESTEQPAGEGEPRTTRAVSVYAAADVPYGVIVPVLYTAAQAEYDPVVVARGAAGDVDLGLDLPRVGAHPSAVRIVLGARGAFVTAEAGLASVHHAKPRPESSLGRPLRGPDRVCPLPPASDGAPDRGALIALLRSLVKRMPEGAEVIILPPPEMRWRAVIAVADAAAEAGFPRFMLGIERDGEPPPDGATAIGADEVRLEDFPRWH